MRVLQPDNNGYLFGMIYTVRGIHTVLSHISVYENDGAYIVCESVGWWRHGRGRGGIALSLLSRLAVGIPPVRLCVFFSSFSPLQSGVEPSTLAVIM